MTQDDCKKSFMKKLSETKGLTKIAEAGAEWMRADLAYHERYVRPWLKKFWAALGLKRS